MIFDEIQSSPHILTLAHGTNLVEVVVVRILSKLDIQHSRFLDECFLHPDEPSIGDLS